MIQLPVKYGSLTPKQRAEVRNLYIQQQKEKCWYCKNKLSELPPNHVLAREIDWKLFPPNFLKYPIHLHHSHRTDKTIGAVHALCNAVLWQYHGQ